MNITRLITMTILLIGVIWGSLCFAQTEIKTEFRTIPQVPSPKLINGIYYVTLDASTPYGRGYQHGAAVLFAYDPKAKTVVEVLQVREKQ